MNIPKCCKDCYYAVPVKYRNRNDIRCLMCGCEESEFDGTEVPANGGCECWLINLDAAGNSAKSERWIEN